MLGNCRYLQFNAKPSCLRIIEILPCTPKGDYFFDFLAGLTFLSQRMRRAKFV